MSLRDPSTGLDCTETPFYPPRVATIGDIVGCTSCKLVLAAPVAGPKGYNFRMGKDGIGIDESPLANLTYNGHNFGLIETIIWKKGAHRNFKADNPYDMEMNLYFRDIYDSTNQVAVAIPITIDDDEAVNYFTELTAQDANKRKNSLETLIEPGPILLYKGMDLRGRNAANPTAGQQCTSSSATINWFVLPTTYISASDAAKIRSVQNPYTLAERQKAIAKMSAAQIATYDLSDALPPVPTHEVTLERTRNMAMIVPKIELQSDIDTAVKAAASKSASKNGIYLTRALQCQRIDPTRDVRNDAVYLNQTAGESTLKDELDKAALLDSTLSEVSSKTGTRAADIENILAITIGVIAGLLIFGVVGYYIMLYFYKDYLKTITTNNAIIAAATAATAADAVKKAPPH
jgi:hypothetical protein